MAETEIGYIDHYFGKIGVTGLKLTKGTVEVGDTLHFKGHTTDFENTISTMQVEHNSIEKAKKGDDIGIKVSDKVRVHDKVYKVT